MKNFILLTLKMITKQKNHSEDYYEYNNKSLDSKDFLAQDWQAIGNDLWSGLKKMEKLNGKKTTI